MSGEKGTHQLSVTESISEATSVVATQEAAVESQGESDQTDPVSVSSEQIVAPLNTVEPDTSPKQANTELVLKIEAEQRKKIDSVFSQIDTNLSSAKQQMTEFSTDVNSVKSTFLKDADPVGHRREISKIGNLWVGERDVLPKLAELKQVFTTYEQKLVGFTQRLDTLSAEFQAFRQQFSQLNAGEGINEARLRGAIDAFKQTAETLVNEIKVASESFGKTIQQKRIEAQKKYESRAEKMRAVSPRAGDATADFFYYQALRKVQMQFLDTQSPGEAPQSTVYSKLTRATSLISKAFARTDD